MKKCSTWKSFVSSKPTALLLGSFGSDIPCSSQVPEDPGTSFLPDGSDPMMKMMPENLENDLMRKNARHGSCSYRRDVQLWFWGQLDPVYHAASRCYKIRMNCSAWWFRPKAEDVAGTNWRFPYMEKLSTRKMFISLVTSTLFLDSSGSGLCCNP